VIICVFGALNLLLCLLGQANTHIHSNPELKDVKVWQVHTLLKGLERIAASATIPMLVAGDFNSVPGRFVIYLFLQVLV
jgi:CCR4-NOT transcription complex subunit 6